MDPQRKLQLGQYFIGPLYLNKYIETIYRAWYKKNLFNGWILKGKIWSPWFFNMRPVGNTPKLFYEICDSLAELAYSHINEFSLLLGIEMAGIPVVTSVSQILMNEYNISPEKTRFGYTRPLLEKARDPEEVVRILNEMKSLPNYGEKGLVEARFQEGDVVALLDDMATDTGSKKIGRIITFREAEKQGIQRITCPWIFYFLNRNPNNIKAGLDFANDPNKDLYPAELRIEYILEFNTHLPELGTGSHMIEEEFQLVQDFQDDTEKYQDKRVQKEVLKKAELIRNKL